MIPIYIHKRPTKIVFLIKPDQNDWEEQIDAIWDYNQVKWGGRYNPIIPTNGEIIEEEWWIFLEKIDPDYVISVSPINEKLTNEIKQRISPIEIEILNSSNDSSSKPKIHTYNEGLSVRPSSSNIGTFAKIISNDLLAAIRGIDWTVEKDVFRFLLRGLGIFQDVYYIDKFLEKIENKKSYRANNKFELATILKELAEPPLDFIYPIQYSMLGKNDWFIELEEGHSYDDFSLIIGDTVEEQIYLRNKVFYERDFRHNRLSHIWLPCSFTEDTELMKALGIWLRRMTQNVHLFSFSLSNEELEKIGEQLDIKDDNTFFGKSLYKKFKSYKGLKFPMPKYGRRELSFSFWDNFSPSVSPPKNCDLYQSNNFKDSFEIKSPSGIDGISESGNWMAEIYIQVDKNRFFKPKYNYYLNQFLWWCLPRKNYLVQNILKANSRINSHGIPVVQLKGKNPILNFDLPNDIDLLKRCLHGDWNGKLTGKVSRKNLQVDIAEPSNIGKYLSGFVDIFGGMPSAKMYLEERYWRTMFDILSGRDLRKDSIVSGKVRDKLSKKIKKGLTNAEIIKNYESLDDYVIELSREVPFESKTLEYKDFLEKAKKEHEEFQNEDEDRKDWEFNEYALKKALSKLLELGVLQMGFSQKCPHCGSRNWYLIDDVRQYVTCDGCRYKYSMPANPEMSYRLNSLVRQGIFAHGLVPVVLVLGQLLRYSNSSFFFAPSMDLYQQISNEPIKYKKLTDSDIVCIKDGKLILGEIKQNQEKFTLIQMMDLADIAESIEADILLFSSLDEKTNNRTNEMIEKVKVKLKDTKIDVGWYQLREEIFSPSRWDV